MPVAVASSSAVTDLAAELASQASSNAGAARATLAGDRSIAFAWADSIPWAGTVFDSVVCEGLTYRKTLVEPTATPAAKTPKGGTKPSAVKITSTTEQLPKYSGLGKIFTKIFWIAATSYRRSLRSCSGNAWKRCPPTSRSCSPTPRGRRPGRPGPTRSSTP